MRVLFLEQVTELLRNILWKKVRWRFLWSHVTKFRFLLLHSFSNHANWHSYRWFCNSSHFREILARWFLYVLMTAFSCFPVRRVSKYFSLFVHPLLWSSNILIYGAEFRLMMEGIFLWDPYVIPLPGSRKVSKQDLSHAVRLHTLLRIFVYWHTLNQSTQCIWESSTQLSWWGWQIRKEKFVCSCLCQ